MEKIKAAIIGYGGMGGWHADHIRNMDKFELAGVWDIDPERLTLAQSRGIRAYGSLEELLADDDAETGRFRMEGLQEEHPLFPAKATPADNLESWEIGRIEDGVFRVEQSFRRSFRYPELVRSLKMDPRDVQAIMTTDAAGIRRAYSTK